MKPTCILTARLDRQSQEFFDEMRTRHFPEHLNFLKAHLTLFHQLTDCTETLDILQSVRNYRIVASVQSVKSIGNGVAYFLDTPELVKLHQSLQCRFYGQLNRQDLMPLRPHITIQNKAEALVAKQLLAELGKSFVPFKVSFTGLDLWHYLNGPWAHYQYFPFAN